jgi:hypothetical protein
MRYLSERTLWASFKTTTCSKDGWRQQVRACELAGVELLCCPEAVLGGLADYVSGPFEIAISERNLQKRLDPIASDT